MKKWLHQNQKIVAFVALVAIGLFVFTTRYPSSPEPTIPPVRSELPADTDQDKLVIIRTGVIENATLLPVNSGFAGKIVEVYVKNGQLVQAGQALFKVEYRVTPAANASDPTGTKKVDSERLKKLYEQGIISRREWESHRRPSAIPKKRRRVPIIGNFARAHYFSDSQCADRRHCCRIGGQCRGRGASRSTNPLNRQRQ